METITIEAANAALRAKWQSARSIQDLASVWDAWESFADEHGLPDPAEQLHSAGEPTG